MVVNYAKGKPVREDYGGWLNRKGVVYAIEKDGWLKIGKTDGILKNRLRHYSPCLDDIYLIGVVQVSNPSHVEDMLRNTMIEKWVNEFGFLKVHSSKKDYFLITKEGEKCHCLLKIVGWLKGWFDGVNACYGEEAFQLPICFSGN